MPGKRITDHQVHKYKKHRNKLSQDPDSSVKTLTYVQMNPARTSEQNHMLIRGVPKCAQRFL